MIDSTNSGHQIKYGAIVSYLSIAVNILAGLIYTPWMIHQLGQSSYALYTLAYSLISLFLLDFGLSSASSRFLSKYRAENDEEKISNFLGLVYKLYLLIDAVIFAALLIVFFYIDSIYENLSPEEIAQFKVVYCIAAGFSLINFPCMTFNGILTAFERFITLKTADLIYRTGTVGLTIIALLMGYGLYTLVAINAFCGLIVILFKFIVIKKSTNIRTNAKHFDKPLFREVFRFSAWAAVAGIAQQLIFNITPTILGIVANSAAIAVFGIVNTIEGYAYSITVAISDMFLPRVSRILTHEGQEEELSTITISVGKFQYALNGLILIGFFLVGKDFIQLWVGADYSLAYYGVLLVLLPGMFYNSLQIVNTAMIAKNMVRLQARISIITGVCCFILSLYFSSLWGIIGASLAICVAYFLRDIYLLIVIYREMNIDMNRFIKECYYKMSLPVISTGITVSLVFQLFSESNWSVLIVKAIIVLLCYLFFVYFLGLNSCDRKALSNAVITIKRQREGREI